MGQFSYHYTVVPSKKIMSEGLLSPSRLFADKEARKQMTKAYSGRVNPKDFLVGLDDLFGDVLGPQKGRNIIYASFGIIPSGLSEGHDEFIEANCFSINIKQLTKDLGEGCRLAVIEIPTDDYRNPLSVETNYEGCKDWLERDLVSANWDPIKSEGFTFGNIPHLAIWTAEGKIPPKYLTAKKPGVDPGK